MNDVKLAKALNVDAIELEDYGKPDNELYDEIIRDAIEKYACRLADRHGDYYAPADESEVDEVEITCDHGNYQVDDGGKPPDDQETC